MARKYSRDNRGRFASSGSGATARGGRLRTAAGNKRKTETMKAAGAGGAGVMKGKVARDPGAMAKVGKAKPKAPQKLEFLRAYHGTHKDAAASIRQEGYKESRYGAKGAGVYLSRSRGTAQTYADNHMEVWGGKIHHNGRVLTHRIPKQRVLKFNESDNTQANHNVFTRKVGMALADRKAVASFKNDPLKTVLATDIAANKTLVRSQGMVRRPNSRRRSALRKPK